MIADYGENRLPCNFGDWKGIGAASQKGLAARGITEPVQLLGHSLVAKMNPVAFERGLAWHQVARKMGSWHVSVIARQRLRASATYSIQFNSIRSSRARDRALFALAVGPLKKK